jgi:hypothetical protein
MGLGALIVPRSHEALQQNDTIDIFLAAVDA